ncbi:AEC family transporter [Pusillimonas sp. DMV24BSW_D]|nr:AEC family transporter [Pusillimonas sp. DMV24BSW_D]
MMLHVIYAALGPIIFGLIVGWICGFYNIFKQDTTQVFADFVVKIALPIALFLAAINTSSSVILNVDFMLALAVGLIVTFVIGLVAGKFLFRHNRKDTTLQALTVSFPDMAYCGPPVLLATVGSSGLIAMVIGNLIYAVIILPIAIILLSGHNQKGGAAQQIKNAVKQPLVILPILGAVLALLGVKLPTVVAASINEIGETAGGVALFFLGLLLSHTRFSINFEIAFNVIIKNVLQAALILTTGIIIGLEGDLLKAAFLIGVLPTATAVPALATGHQAYESQAAATVFISTIASLISIIAGIAIVESL